MQSLLIVMLTMSQAHAFRVRLHKEDRGNKTVLSSSALYPMDVLVLIRSHRNQNLQDYTGQVKLSGNTGSWEQWLIRDAGNGFVTIRSGFNRNLQDNQGLVSLTTNEGSWERWKIGSSGDGKVTIQSHRGQSLQDFNGQVRLKAGAFPCDQCESNGYGADQCNCGVCASYGGCSFSCGASNDRPECTASWEEWSILPVPTRRLLVVGSSVSTGEGCWDKAKSGWAALLAESMLPYGFAYENHGKGGTTVDHWQWVLRQSTGIGTRLNAFDIVFLSLSLGNEGLPSKQSINDMLQIESHYTTGLLNIVKEMRSRMLPNARLVIGGPYPNGVYNHDHLQVLQRVFALIKSWPEVDYAVDFLAPPCHDGQGRWHSGASRDAGHPNDLGHKQMFQCIELSSVLGPLERNL